MLSGALLILISFKKRSGFLAVAFILLNVLDVFNILIIYFQQIVLVPAVYIQVTELGAMRLQR